MRAGKRLCALPVEHVEETLRPLPIESFRDVPPFVRGASIVRGEPIPIVDLRILLGDDEAREAARLVVLRTDGRRVGLLVDEVLGVHRDLATSGDVPPLLQEAATNLVEALERLDGKLLTVLRSGNLLPEEIHTRVSDTQPLGTGRARPVRKVES